MKVYLVGGAVRDITLGIKPKDFDYVVVGATEQDMLDRGFIKIEAQSFPVFHHPDTREEYALARREKKTGPGYHGFDVDFGPEVTLEEDLLRRDLTINAMAIDQDTGVLIDPYGGTEDCKLGLIRHTSNAFMEDPVRVLRAARFAARYNFGIHDDTLALMRSMVDAGDLDELTKERVWKELSSALMEAHPRRFVETLKYVGAFEKLFDHVYLYAIEEVDKVPANLVARCHYIHAEPDQWQRYSVSVARTMKAAQDLQEVAEQAAAQYNTSADAVVQAVERFCSKNTDAVDAAIAITHTDKLTTKEAVAFLHKVRDSRWVLDIHWRDVPLTLSANVEPRERGTVTSDYRAIKLQEHWDKESANA